MILQIYKVKNVKHWIKDIKNIDKDIKGIIVRNKCYLESKRIIELNDSNKFSDKYKMPVLEISAKGWGIVDECFDLFVRGII